MALESRKTSPLWRTSAVILSCIDRHKSGTDAEDASPEEKPNQEGAKKLHPFRKKTEQNKFASSIAGGDAKPAATAGEMKQEPPCADTGKDGETAGDVEDASEVIIATSTSSLAWRRNGEGGRPRLAA